MGFKNKVIGNLKAGLVGLLLSKSRISTIYGRDVGFAEMEIDPVTKEPIRIIQRSTGCDLTTYGVRQPDGSWTQQGYYNGKPYNPEFF